jgi:two-component system, cell cycle response regulator
MKKILHFEDDSFLAEMYGSKMKRAGLEYVRYENPSDDPIALVKKENPDLILMNVIMPVMDGFKATEILVNNKDTNNIPIVGLTSLGQDKDMQKGLDLGMKEYLVKADNMPNEVVEKLREILGLPPENSDKWATGKKPIFFHSSAKDIPEFTNRPPKIVMFEDDTMLLEMYGAKLAQEGFKIKLFEYPSEDVVEVVNKEKPDLISMGVIMPQMDGFKATELLKADERTKDIPLIFLTNLSQNKDIEKGMNLGANDYIVKANHTPTEVVQIFRKLLGIPKKRKFEPTIPKQAMKATQPVTEMKKEKMDKPVPNTPKKNYKELYLKQKSFIRILVLGIIVTTSLLIIFSLF